MVAESWEQVARSAFMKSWKKLWPSVCDLPENNIVPVREKSARKKDSNEVQLYEFMHLCLRLQICLDVDLNNTGSWLE